MLSKEDNDLLTRVGAGTPMGELLRRYWIPVMFNWELVADGTPERVRLLGEDLLAFRDTQGRVGIVSEWCAHRGASLYFARNEECGLACIYHGWKFDVEGRCVDMPNEPLESNFANKVRIKAYPCVEKAGTIWVYMGPERPLPPLPQLEWLELPESHYEGSKRVQPTNWVQALEGDIDQSHLGFTHRLLQVPDPAPRERPSVAQVQKLDTRPRFQVVEKEYGYVVGATRHTNDPEWDYTRITQFLMPFHTMTGVTGRNPVHPWRAWVPIDDENTLVFGVYFHPLEPLGSRRRGSRRLRGPVTGGNPIISEEMRAPKTSEPFGAWRPLPGLENDFFQDRGYMMSVIYSGIREFWAQDAAPQYTMFNKRPIADRTQEHLGTTDRAIIAARNQLIRAAKALADTGESPPGVANPKWYMVRSGGKFHRSSQWWYAEVEEELKAVPGTNPDCSVWPTEALDGGYVLSAAAASQGGFLSV